MTDQDVTEQERKALEFVARECEKIELKTTFELLKAQYLKMGKTGKFHDLVEPTCTFANVPINIVPGSPLPGALGEERLVDLAIIRRSHQVQEMLRLR